MGSRVPALMFTLFLGMAAHAADDERAPIARDDDPVKHPLIAGIFVDAFPEDERADREKITTLTRLVQAMNPEQREAARSALSLEEAKARDPAALAEISRGYYLLGAHDQSLRLSRALVRENPENLDALRLSAAASFHSEDHESAARDAKAVLDADPDDKDARVIWMFSKDRARAASVRAPSDPFQKKDAETGPSGGGSSDPPNSKRAFKRGLTNDLPGPPPVSGPIDAPRKDGSPLWPLTLPLGAGLIGYGVYRRKHTATGEGLDPEPDLSEEQMTENRRRGYMVGGALLAIGLTAGTAWYAGPAIMSGIRVIPALTAPIGQKVADSAQRIGQSATQVMASNAGAVMPGENAVASRAATISKFAWNTWNGYAKTTHQGRLYAQIGNRLYTEHAVERMMPRALSGDGRSVAPTFVEDVIRIGSRHEKVVDGVLRTAHRSGNLEVITEQNGLIVVTVKRIK
jgi:tetratricopeptide (TPR) repeat protein